MNLNNKKTIPEKSAARDPHHVRMRLTRTKQIPRRLVHNSRRKGNKHPANRFDYSLDYKNLNLRDHPELYKVGVSEQGVLLVEPYKSEILPHWKFRTPELAKKSASKIYALFFEYLKHDDFVGMDMARKYLQMGFTRASRYANHSSGQKYSSDHKLLDFDNDFEKAKSAAIFHAYWKKVEAHALYASMKLHWKAAFG